MAKIRKPRRGGSRTARPLPEVWQLDVAEPGGDEPCAVMLVDVRTAEPLAAEVCVVDEVPARIADALSAAASARSADGRPPWPERIEVRNPLLERWMLDFGARQGITIARVDRLPQLEAAAARLRGELDARGPRFFVPGLPQALYEAAAELVELAPWARWTDRNLLVLEDSAGTLPFPVLSTVGSDGLVRGLVLHPSLDACRGWLEGHPQGADSAVPADASALMLWMQDANELGELERKLFAGAGWSRSEDYPAFLALAPGGALTMPDDAEADALLDAIEAALVFFADHPQPPADGTAVTLAWDDGRRLTVTHRPLIDPQAMVSLLAFDVQLFPMELGREALETFDAQLDPEQRLGDETLAALPSRLRALGMRSRREDVARLLERLEALEVDGLGVVGGQERAALVAWSGDRPVGRLIDCDAAFAATLAASAEALGDRVVVVFSGGGTHLRTGRIRGRDAVALRSYGWRRLPPGRATSGLSG